MSPNRNIFADIHAALPSLLEIHKDTNTEILNLISVYVAQCVSKLSERYIFIDAQTCNPIQMTVSRFASETDVKAVTKKVDRIMQMFLSDIEEDIAWNIQQNEKGDRANGEGHVSEEEMGSDGSGSESGSGSEEEMEFEEAEGRQEWRDCMLMDNY